MGKKIGKVVKKTVVKLPESYLTRKGLKAFARSKGFKLTRDIHNGELREIQERKLSPDSARGREILKLASARSDMGKRNKGKGRGYRAANIVSIKPVKGGRKVAKALKVG